MKKLLFTVFLAVALSACGTAYNSALKQIELGMTKEQVVGLMGDKYTVVQSTNAGNDTITYKDKFKNHWFFVFDNGQLVKWYKETE